MNSKVNESATAVDQIEALDLCINSRITVVSDRFLFGEADAGKEGTTGASAAGTSTKRSEDMEKRSAEPVLKQRKLTQKKEVSEYVRKNNQLRNFRIKKRERVGAANKKNVAVPVPEKEKESEKDMSNEQVPLVEGAKCVEEIDVILSLID